MLSKMPGDEVRNVPVKAKFAIAVALPDGEEADAMAAADTDDVRTIDAPGAIVKEKDSLNVPDGGVVKIIVEPSMTVWLYEADAAPVGLTAVVRVMTPEP